MSPAQSQAVIAALIGVGAALCASLLVWLAAQPLAQRAAPTSPRPAAEVQRRPWLLRWLVAPLGRLLARWDAPWWRAPVQRRLERANLEALITVPEWVAVHLLCGVACGLVTAWWVSGPPGAVMLRVGVALMAGGCAPALWLRDRIQRIRDAVLRELPGYLDMLTLGLEAGCAFGAALQIAAARSRPGPLQQSFGRALQEMRSGRSRAEALHRMQARVGVAALSATVAAIVQAEATGISLAPVMRAQAARGTRERFARAEKLAMEAPVKMLAPLILCIFPCTFIVVGFPIAVRLFWWQ